jgi:hypothetical protein
MEIIEQSMKEIKHRFVEIYGEEKGSENFRRFLNHGKHS